MLELLALLMQQCLFFLGYITGRSEFPPALNRAEEAELIGKLDAGDHNARQELITHNLRLVSHIARKYQIPGYGADDLISIGVIGLIKAVDSFKSASGTPLGTYAARCIENEILGTDADELENTVIRRVTAEKVQQVLHRLPARERFVLELRYGLTDGRQHPQHEIARRLGISRSYVSRVEKKAVALLRDEIER